MNACKNFPIILAVLFIFIASGIQFAVAAESKNSLKVETKPDETQQISILVGKSSNISPLADGDPEEGEEGESAPEVESTAYDWCRNNRCCYQFTWPGYVQEIPSDPANTTCEYLKKQKKDEGMACFDPVVYTTAGEGKPAIGSGPDIPQLTRDAQVQNWNIFCPLTQEKSCITYKYFNKGQGNKVVNETRFCGSVTETNSGSRKSSGCFKQVVQGYIREVCVCGNDLCNSAMKVQQVGVTTFTLTVIMLLLVYY